MSVCAFVHTYMHSMETVGRTGGRGSGKEGDGVEDNVMEEGPGGAASHWVLGFNWRDLIVLYSMLFHDPVFILLR